MNLPSHTLKHLFYTILPIYLADDTILFVVIILKWWKDCLWKERSTTIYSNGMHNVNTREVVSVTPASVKPQKWWYIYNIISSYSLFNEIEICAFVFVRKLQKVVHTPHNKVVWYHHKSSNKRCWKPDEWLFLPIRS